MKSLYRLAFLLSISIHSFGQIPAISDFTPTSGPVGTSVTITGSNFSTTSSDNIVYFGAVKADVTNALSNTLTVTVPPGATYQPISATVNGLTAYSSKIFITTFPEGGFINPSSFGSPINFRTESTNTAAIADLDGDGKSDIAAVGNTQTGRQILSVYRNISTGSLIAFAPAIDFTLGANNSEIAIGDLDGDGKLDIAVTSEPMHNVYVLRNICTPGSITTGSFEPSVTFGTAQFPFDVSIKDLDLDGKPELVVATEFAKISVLRNTSTTGSITTASFAAAVNFTVGTESLCVATGDLDGDGKPELIANSTNGSTISILRNTSSPGSITAGSFAAKVDFPTGPYPSGIVIADLDGDNKSDIAVTNNSSVSVFRNISVPGSITTGSFSPKVDFPAEANPNAIVVGDIDGDGKPDLCINRGNTFSIFRNASTPGILSADSFEPKIDVGNNLYTKGGRVSIADLNNDSKPDLTYSGFGNAGIFPNILGPFISDFTPLNGKEGDVVTINGHNFDPVPTNNIVKFNGTTAVVSGSTSSSIVTTVPPGTTNGLITVEVNGSLCQSPGVFTVPPVITSFSPSSGLAGSTVVISGSNFDPLPSNNVVAFNGANAYVINRTLTSITVIVPSGATSGLISVSVNGITATSTSAFGIKQNQSIIFNGVAGTKTLGDLPFTLDATASSGLPVQFSAASDKVSISGNQVTLLIPGSVTITASQSGNDVFIAASPVTQTFCINPMKPRITIENSDDGLPTLVSSSSTGNQWYHNGFAISGETSSLLNVTESGFYNVKVAIDNCVSQISDDANLTVTGFENAHKGTAWVYPIPAQQRISLELGGFDNGRPVEILIYNTMSQLMEHTTADGNQRKLDLDISKLPRGIYILHAGQEKITRQAKFVKED